MPYRGPPTASSARKRPTVTSSRPWTPTTVCRPTPRKLAVPEFVRPRARDNSRALLVSWRRFNTYYRDHPAGFLTVPAERVEHIWVAGGAKPRDINLPLRNTGGEQLPADKLRQVDTGPLRRLAELDRDLRAHLKAARTDTGADCGMEILRSAI